MRKKSHILLARYLADQMQTTASLQSHRKAFCQAVSRKGLKEGSIIEIAITTPEGEKIETNLKVKDSDLELLKQLSDLKM